MKLFLTRLLSKKKILSLWRPQVSLGQTPTLENAEHSTKTHAKSVTATSTVMIQSSPDIVCIASTVGNRTSQRERQPNPLA
jgi:hypothetical protein